MDPFDEFEFKPITEGLGFHKKKTDSAASNSDVAPLFKSEPTMRDTGLTLLEDSGLNPLQPPLPRKNRTNTSIDLDTPSSSTAAVDEILKTLQKNKNLEKATQKTKLTARPNKTEDYRTTTWNFSAALLDGMLVLAASLLCMIVVLMITKVDLVGSLTNPASSTMLYVATLTLFAGVSFIYLVVNRAFLGCTPGEWAFDIRIGKPEETNSARYAINVVLRSLLVIFTGFVALPIASLALNKDIAGQITGAILHKKS